MYSSTWHGFLEPLVDVWEQLRRLERRDRANVSADTKFRCPRYDILLTDEVLGRKEEWATGYLQAYWRAFAAFGADSIRSLLDVLVTSPNHTVAAPGRAYHNGSILDSWATVVQGPLTCYRRVVVGAPCCSPFPFNRRGDEDLLRHFGDCMLESFAQPEASRLSGPPSDGGLGARGVAGHATLGRLVRDSATAAAAAPWTGTGGGGERVGSVTSDSGPTRRRAAFSSLSDIAVLILDRDECDRRLVRERRHRAPA
jgi:hypothetical protein